MICLQLYTATGCMDEQLLEHVQELLEELGDQPSDGSEDNQDENSICSDIDDEMETT